MNPEYKKVMFGDNGIGWLILYSITIALILIGLILSGR
jgi:hypothetical protein